MVFSSLEFLTLFLPAFLIIYAAARPQWRNAVLLVGSWLFYSWWSPVFLLLLVFVTLLAWAGGLVLQQTLARQQLRQAGRWLAALIVINIAVLCWFKYSNILVATYNSSTGWTGAMPVAWQKVVLPAGLSFFILQAISYLVDVRRQTVQAQANFVTFGAYIAMFGQLIAGPIIRYDWINRELEQRDLLWSDFRLGARRFMIGMSMKVLIADTLAPIADRVFALSHPTLADAWLGNAAYTLQLFFDFAGYSAMAIGLGLMLGFHFPENFKNPYVARSIQDFWRRWHLSLSSWIRDYLYISMGGNRHGTFNTYRNLFLTMAIAGLWHGGDSWNFLLWGMAHGAALCLARAWTRLALPGIPVLLSWLLTLVFVMLAWTLFRATSFDGAMAMYHGQFGLNGIALSDSITLAWRPVHTLAMLGGMLCIVLPTLQPWFERQAISQRLLVLRGLWPILAFLWCYSLLVSRGATPFLYFQF